MKYYLAIDIGASSGRHIVGWQENGEVCTLEVYRFPNGVSLKDGHLTWDLNSLIFHVKEGLKQVFSQYPKVESLSIDTWGVDYVLLRGEEEVLPCFAYRDSRTEEFIPQLHKIVPFAELYAHTGCQFQPFNSVYQWYTDLRWGRLEGVTDALMMPEYLMYKLSGVKAREYTNGTTSRAGRDCCVRGGNPDGNAARAIRGQRNCIFPRYRAVRRYDVYYRQVADAA